MSRLRLDGEVIDLLRSRDGVPTAVELKNGRVFTVFNIAWGYDEGDGFAHVTTNVSPPTDGRSIDYFFTNEIVRVVDPVTTAVLFASPEGSAG